MMYTRRLKWSVFVMLSASVFILCIIYTTNRNQTDVRYCFINGFNQQQQSTRNHNIFGPHILEDVMLSETKPNSNGPSIIFHETSCPNENQRINILNVGNAPINMMHLTAREACAIESAALHHPNLNVFALFVSPTYRDNKNTPPVMEAILQYPNVHLRNLNLWTYAAGTPMYHWLKEGNLFKSSYVISHLSDFLRYLTLWRWGGTYLDMDVVVLRSLETLPPNYTGAESNTLIAAGVMGFAADGFGHEIAKKCIYDFLKNFNGSNWANNGPGVITRVANDICKTSNIELMMMDPDRCMGFRVMPPNAFYAVHWLHWEHFFDPQYCNETLNKLRDSYIAHVWNKLSKQRRFKVGEKAAYGIIAEKHCPKVYAASGEYF
ncbi:lactosylceramide 4-alpha-galactosyltransferase-like [Eurosta solidaginis]|uniref:lactosylceramide 4-alpha-galactosyltransferase-like n=1 Tax=Eurosta solidaginis TaxID=178769 RepID=UPI003530ABA0